MTRRPPWRLLGEAAIVLAATAGVVALLWPYATAGTLELQWQGERYQILEPAMLFAVAVVPCLAWIATRSLADLPAPQRVLGTALRALLVATLALAMAQLVRTTETSRISTVFLVDVSDSVADETLAKAREHVQAAWEARGADDELHLVTFARDARVVDIPEDADRVPEITRHRRPRQAGAGSDLQGALQLAYGLFDRDHLRRVVLLSDGGQTEGDLLAEADRAARFGVRLSYHPYRAGAPAEVGTDALEVPDRPEVGEPFHVRARIFATEATKARVRLYQGQTLNGLGGVRDVELEPGVNKLEFRSIVRVAGPVTYRIVVEPEGPDRFAHNNHFETTAVAPGKPRVLYVEGAKGRASYLARALSTADFDVDVRRPRGLPTTLSELRRYDFFILSDVPAERVSLSQMKTIERWVRDVGGGFLMAGGEQGFGLGGWRGTRIERLLPVRMDAERRRDRPSLALALVMDKSGSMNGQKIELAKEAAKATAKMLGPNDYISVVGFDSRPERVVRMQSARNRMQILRDIGRLAARGGTNIFPALDMAYQDLSVTRAKIKHVILLTDGQSPERGIHELVQVMRTEDITVSTVGLGADVKRSLLQQLANEGDGRAYFTNDPHNIPRIFTKETNTVARSAAVEEYFQPRVVERADFLRGIDLVTAPFLHGYVATKPKPAPAQIILQSELGEPILARWRVGLGWALAWTSGVKNRWAVEWLQWPGYSRFWAQLIREHMRQRRRRTLEMKAHVTGDEVHAVVDAIGKNDRFLNGLDSRVTIDGPMGASGDRDGQQGRIEETHPLRQTAPGRYEARFPLDRYGSFLLHAVHRQQGETVAESSAQLAHPYPREYRTLEPDEALLRRAARVTGGEPEPSPASVFDPRGESIEAHHPLWPVLLFVALVLFVVDLLLRRVRLFDRRLEAAPRGVGARAQT